MLSVFTKAVSTVIYIHDIKKQQLLFLNNNNLPLHVQTG